MHAIVLDLFEHFSAASPTSHTTIHLTKSRRRRSAASFMYGGVGAGETATVAKTCAHVCKHALFCRIYVCQLDPAKRKDVRNLQDVQQSFFRTS